MQTPEQKEIDVLMREQFGKLPPLMQRAIGAVGLRERFERVEKKNRLHVDQAGALENETVLTLLGFKDPDEFPKNIAAALSMSPEEAGVIMEDINESIFLPIQELMRGGSEENRPAAPENPPATSAPAEAAPAQKPATPEHGEKHLDKESLLADIENPERLLPSPVHREEKELPAPAQKPAAEMEKASADSGKPLIPSPSAPRSVPREETLPRTEIKNIFEQKLSEPTRTPRQEVRLQSSGGEHLDPYREPIK